MPCTPSDGNARPPLSCRPRWLRHVLAGLIGMRLLLGSLPAPILYWDTNGTTTGAGTTPTATWSTTGGTNKNWSSNSAGTVNGATFTSGSDAVFSAGTDAINAYTVTLAATQNVASITIEEGSPTFN